MGEDPGWPFDRLIVSLALMMVIKNLGRHSKPQGHICELSNLSRGHVRSRFLVSLWFSLVAQENPIKL
jgi:hypothetical protein